MLEGKNLLTLPDYDGRTPTEGRVRCPEYGALYFVFTTPAISPGC